MGLRYAQEILTGKRERKAHLGDLDLDGDMTDIKIDFKEGGVD